MERTYFVWYMYGIVIHIGIDTHWTYSKETHKSCVCYQHAKHGPNTLSGRMFNCVLHVESKHRTCASLCYTSNIDIFLYDTHNTLYFEHHQHDFKTTDFTKARVSQSVGYQATNLKVLGSNPTVVNIFSLCILSLSHTNGINHDVHPR